MRDSVGENLSEWLSVGDSFSVREGALCLLLCSVLGPHQAQTCVGPVSNTIVFCEFVYASVLLRLEGLAFLVSSFPSGSYHLSLSSTEFPEPLVGRELI